jgi:hypothetical protein
MRTGKGWDVAAGQHSVQSVEIDGDFGVNIGRSRYAGREMGRIGLPRAGTCGAIPPKYGESRASVNGCGRLSSTLLGRKGCPQ